MMRTLSPVSPLSPASSSNSSTSYFSASPATPSMSHKRRKSSCSDVPEQRRPKKGDEDYVKRPENAFILFRRQCCEDRLAEEQKAEKATDAKPARKQRQADLSKTISQQWKALAPEEKAKWEALAKERKKEHEEQYPNYVYRPQRNKERERARRAGRTSEDDSEGNIQFLMPWPAPTSPSSRHGRSASAPTPPPQGYATIQLPNLYMPSCPASPSLMPMINRRLPHPDYQQQDTSSQFDYIPQGHSGLAPPPNTFSQPSVFDPPPVRTLKYLARRCLLTSFIARFTVD